MSSAPTPELLIYGDITDYKWFDEDVTAKEFARDLKALGEVDNLTVRINSCGGSVFAAVAIYNTLKRHSAHKTVYIDGLAASAASLIAMAGDEIIMPENSMLMIHNVMEFMYGLYNADELREKAELLDEITDASILTIYCSRTGRSEEEVQTLMDAETWMSAQEAVELGFADRIEGELQPSAMARCGTYNIAQYKNIPENVKARLGGNKGMTDKTTKNPTETELAEKEQSKVKAVAALAAKIDPSLRTALSEALPDTPFEQTEAYQKGLQVGIQSERERLKALDELNVPDCKELLHDAKYVSFKSPGQVALDILAYREHKGQAAFNALTSDAKASGAYEVEGASAPSNERTAVADVQVNQTAASLANIVNEKRGFKKHE